MRMRYDTVYSNIILHNGNPPRKSYDFPKSVKRYIRNKYSCCQICGECREYYEVAHLFSGDPTAPCYLEWLPMFFIRSNKNATLLCHDCHIKFDHMLRLKYKSREHFTFNTHDISCIVIDNNLDVDWYLNPKIIDTKPINITIKRKVFLNLKKILGYMDKIALVKIT
jgi:hypothetical protein